MGLVAAAVVLCPLASAQRAEIDALVQEGITKNFEGDRAGADRVSDELRALDPTHPASAVLKVDTLFWRQIYDEDDTTYDADIEAGSRQAIRLAEAQLAIDPDDVEAHYYLGRALIDLSRLEGTRRHFLRAGRHGEQAREQLERALMLDPLDIDAKYPVGLYYYYADRVTVWFKWLRWLPFVPSGDGPTGLRYLHEVSEDSALHRWDARLVLSIIDTYYQPVDYAAALERLRELNARFPANTFIHFELLEVLYMTGRYAELIDSARQLEAQPPADALDRGRSDMARVWRARADLALGRLGEAEDLLSTFPEEGPDRPLWGGAWVPLMRGQIFDARGEREAARYQYERVTELKPPRRNWRAAALAEQGLREPVGAVAQAASGVDPRP